MSADGIAGIGAAAVTTVGTLAVTGMALKAVGKTTSRMNGSRPRKASRGRSSKKSLLGF